MTTRLGEEVDGNNQMGSLEIYLKRLLYNTFAYTENGGQGPHGVVDFQFGEKMMYGRISRGGSPIMYANRGTKHVPGLRGQSVEMVSFVADAFNEMTKKIKRDLRTGVLPPNTPFIPQIIPKASYTSPVQAYNAYSDSLFEAYVVYINKYHLSSKLIKVQDHYRIYEEFLANLIDLGFNTSMSGYIRSKRANPRISGLVIDLELFDFSNDDGKTDFIDSEFFDYYVGVARKHGFSINKHIPTRLVLDLDSPFTRKYITRYSAPTVDDVLRLYYKPVWTEGYNKFKKDMVNFYNRYAKKFPRIITKSDQSRKLVNVQREMDKRGDIFYLKKYIEFRNREEGTILAHAEKEYLKKRSTDLFKLRGIDNAVEYAEKEFSRLAMEKNTFASIRKTTLGY